MTAFSFKSYAAREKVPGDRTPLITIQHGHPLNNDHRAPFSSGRTAARGLLVHAQRQLADPVKGPEFFNRLRSEFDKSTINGQRVQQRLRQRQARAANALSNGDVELNAEQLEVMVEIAMVQAQIAERLLPEISATGQSADKVIDELDTITRGALRDMIDIRALEAAGQEPNASNWQDRLVERMDAATPGQDNIAIVGEFDRALARLEATLPQAIDRDEPLWEIDESLDPVAVALTRDRLSDALGADFNPLDADAIEELDADARAAVYANMSEGEREFAATKIALTPGQRIEVGMQMINSTPPLIKLPEAELAQGRYDVRMATEEEARAMDALIRFAGETRTYPGPEAARAHLEAMKELPMPAAEQGRVTMGIAVANEPAAISHASNLIAQSAQDPNLRLIVHADIDSVREELQRVRAEALREAGREPNFAGSDDATRDFGGWTLPDNGEDRFIGTGAHDAAIFVANADHIMAYTHNINLEIGRISDALNDVSRANSAVKTTERDRDRAVEAMLASRDPQLVAAATALGEAGQDNREALALADASADQKLVKEVETRENAVKTALSQQHNANRRLQTMEREAEQDAYRVSSAGDIARATIVDLAQQQGKLLKVYVPASKEEGAAVETKGGYLAEQRNYIAQQKAQRLRNGDANERSNLRSIFHSRSGVNAILVDGSNFFREDKGAAKGMEALRNRIADLPKTATLLTSANERNAISTELADMARAAGRPLIVASAWRVSDISKATMDGRQVTLSERKTELDLGIVGYKGERLNPETGKTEKADLARKRDWVYKDLKGAVVAVEGGGSMTQDTFNAIQELAVQRGAVGRSLTNQEVMQAYDYLVANGKPNLEAPKPASPQLARAIMQEALVDYASQAIIATDMGKDFHSANLIRQAADADKLASVIDKDGKTVGLEAVYSHSLQYAPSIADNTRQGLGDKLNTPTQSSYGQMVLASLPKVTPERARLIGETYGTLGDVMRAAEAGEATPALPKAFHHDLSRPNNWASAVERTEAVGKAIDEGQLDPIASTTPEYPAGLRESGRSDMLYVAGDVDLNTPTLAMVIGGDSRPTAADEQAARTMASEAQAKGWAVSIHLSGETSAAIAKTIAEMPENERPRILLVGDGHPNGYSKPQAREALVAVGNAGGGYITATPPALKGKEQELDVAMDRRVALDIHARQASAVAVVKCSGNDMEMLTLRSAMAAGRPVAAVGPSDLASPTVDDLRYRSSDYSANRRLLAGGDRVSIMLETRHLAFQPNFIPDMTAQTQNRYVLFEGSTAGMQKLPDGIREEQEIDRSAVETSSRISTEVAWGDKAEYIADGRGTGDFLTKVEAGEARQIEANEADLARMTRQNDLKFLDTSHRMNARADVQEIFKAVAEHSQADIDADTQSHFLAQRAGMGR